MLEHYKSLISDDEVVKELIKDSKKLEGTWVPPRPKPNLQFFQRTVNNIMANNKRVTKYQDTFKAKYQKTPEEIQKFNKLLSVPVPKTAQPYSNEVFRKINFVKARDDRNSTKTQNVPDKLKINNRIAFAETRNRSKCCISIDLTGNSNNASFQCNCTPIICVSSGTDSDSNDLSYQDKIKQKKKKKVEKRKKKKKKKN